MSQDAAAIRALLADSRTIAVVGLSAKPHRPSHSVAKYLQLHGYRIVPVNPTYAGTRILGEYCHSSLPAAAQAMDKEGARIDIVDCFRSPEFMEPLADEAIAIQAHCLWMQLGVVNEAAAANARAAGVFVVMDKCLKIEHAFNAERAVAPLHQL